MEPSEPLTALAEQELRSLLDDHTAPGVDLPADSVLVVPRTGTVSPWSSKATDIARSCGLLAVRRVERAEVLVREGVGFFVPVPAAPRQAQVQVPDRELARQLHGH